MLISKKEGGINMSSDYYITTSDFYDDVREIFKSEIEQFKKKISSDDYIVKIGFITDTHYVIRDDGYYSGDLHKPGMAERSRTHIFNLGYLSDKLDFVVHGGDIIDGVELNNYVQNQLTKDIGTLFNLMSCPSAMCIGNHDNNSFISTKQGGGKNRLKVWKDFLVHPETQNEFYLSDDRIHKSSDNNYWYYDIKGIRVVGLDTFEQSFELDEEGYLKYPAIISSVITQKQIDWLIETLSTDFPVIIFTHAPIDKTIQEYKSIEYPINHDVLRKIMLAKKQGQKGKVSSQGEVPIAAAYDFSQYQNSIISIVNGHLHTEILKQWNNINLFSGINSVGLSSNRKTLYWDTKLEDAIYIFEIDLKNKIVNIQGYGRANDFNYNFE